MNSQQQLTADLKSAMLARDSEKVETLRGLKSVILYEEVALKKRDTGLTDEEVTAVFRREAKKRQDAIALYKQGGNEASATKEAAELEIIKSYLPAMLSEEDTHALVNQAVETLSIETLQQSDTGKIIGWVKSKAGASADPAVISKIVREKIGQ